MKKDVIIQARMGSTRLPGKVLKDLSGKPVLWHVVERVKKSQLIDEVIIATTLCEKDDEIVKFCEENKIKYYRGSEENVLKRYYDAASFYNSDIIIRVTSDCPLIDPEVIDEILAFYLGNSYDLVTNAGSDLTKRTYPRGLDTEIFSYNILKEAYKNAINKHETEHVTPYIYKNGYNIFYYKNRVDYSKYRLTLDTTEDYALIKKIYDSLYSGVHVFFLKEIVEFLENNPNIAGINKMNIQKDVVCLREADEKDMRRIYNWANDEAVRANSFNSEPIKWDIHRKWYQTCLASEDCLIFIAEIDQRAVGQIRIDIEKKKAIIDYSIAKEYRGHSYGKYMIFELIRKIKENRAMNKKIDYLIGKVKKENIASIKTFEKLSFNQKYADVEKVVFEMMLK